MRAILFILLTVFISYTGFSQTKGKFAHIDVAELLTLMPQKDSATKVWQEYGKQLEDQLLAMQKELEDKYNAYVKDQATMSDLVKKTKEDELNQMNTRIQNFQQQAQQDLANKENELMKPIIEKAQAAIKPVGEENGYIYVFDKSMLLYFSGESTDILPLVKKKLGIK